MSGYADARYARSLAEFGEPKRLTGSEGWLLEREIGGQWRDLMGPYPLFACRNWAQLPDDLAALEGDAVSVVLVADPLGGADEDTLQRAFPDLMSPYKRHHVRDLEQPGDLPTHHRRHVRRSAAALEVSVCEQPVRHLDDWTRLYSGLAERHGLIGIRGFSRAAFEHQLAMPSLVAVRAVRDAQTVGMALWLVDAPNAHYHLAAYAPEGYEVSASYAIFDHALRHLHALGVRWVDLGGSPGAGTDAEGLERFKRGWATHERIAHLCGRVLDRPAYDRLSRGRDAAWFPAYRAAERDLGAT